MSTERFHTVRVAAIGRTGTDAAVLTLETPDTFRPFRAGQYLTLRATIEGQDIRRSYSLCSVPDEPLLRVGVKHLAGGVFSTWVNTVLKPGGALRASRPEGRFTVPESAGGGRVFAAFAAGSGITPILSILTDRLVHEPNSRFFLFCGNRSTATIMFRDEIENLKDRYLSRLSVFHVLSRESQELAVLNGRLDAAKIPALLRMMPVPDRCFVCGPQAMIEALEPALAAAGLPEDRIHVERFTPAPGAPRVPVPVTPGVPVPVTPGAPVPVTPGAPVPVTPGAPVLVTPGAPPAAIATLILDGARIDVPMAADETIIDAALRAGRDPPFSCKAGMCCTCRARLIEGQVTMAANYSLEPWETEAGYVLTCQARPLTPAVTVDFDQV